MDSNKILWKDYSYLERTSSAFSHFGSDYAFAHLTNSNALSEFVARTIRVEGLTMILGLGGHLDLQVNVDKIEISKNMLAVLPTGSVVSVSGFDTESVDYYMFFASRDFLRDLSLDTNLLNVVSVDPTRDPVVTLTSEEMMLMKGYFDLIHFNTSTNKDAMFVRNISRNLLVAAMYQLLQFVYTHEGSRSEESDTSKMSPRRKNYVREFMSLVFRYHRTQRNTAFYAEQLFVSPKYLSHVIKDATGMSAAEWIDHYVIQEAKNMLRYSGMNVQQIAYDLNFPNQSAFGKYFKRITGMSPSDFQRAR